ncbi:MAG: TIGR02099 family protein [Moraxellaceae bacterium]|nr:TIGR02099 family protein [Moraxellaceae bacterium]
MQGFKWHYWQGISKAAFKHSLRWLIYIVLVLTVIVLVIKSSLIALEKNQRLLEERLSHAINAPVKLQGFKATWQGIEPELQISQLKIYHPQHQQQVIFSVPHIKLELALWHSLLNLEWRLDGTITGLNLNISQTQQGEWLITELLALGESRPETRKVALSWLLKQAKWSLNKTQIRITPYQQPGVDLNQLIIKNHNVNHHHAFRVYGLVNEQPFQVFADLKHSGNILRAHSWSGKVYGKLPSLSWQNWLNKVDNLTIDKANLEAEAWFELQAGHLQSASAKLNVQQLAATLAEPSQLINFQHFAATVAWQQHKQGWQVSIQDAQGTVNQQNVKLQQLSVDYQNDKMSFGIKELDIAQASNVLRTVAYQHPNYQKVQTWLSQAQPTGRIHSLTTSIDIAQKKLLNAAAKVQHLSVLATQNMIGVKNANLWLSHQPTGGVAGLDIAEGAVDLKPIYREVTPLSSLNVSLKWTDLGDAWLIDSNQIQLKNNDAHGQAVLSLWLPKADPSAAQMQLLASIYNGNLASVWRYVPWPSAGDDTLAWLKKSLVSGNIERGDFLYQGVLFDTPQRPPSTMQMQFKVKDALLDYAPDWPVLSNLNADIEIYNHALTISAKSGRIYQSAARDIVAKIPDLNTPILYLNAGIDTVGDDLLRLFTETPLKEDVAHFAEMIGIKGEIAGDLAFSLPLSEQIKQDMKVEVSADLVGNPIVLRQAPDFDLWLSGTVKYQTGLGLSSLPLQGYLLTQPVNVKLQSVLNAGEIAAVQIQANGQLAPVNLKPWLGNVTQSMRGQTHYNTLLTVPMTDDPVHIVLDSNLQGWQIDLPEPFKKSIEKIQPVHYEMELHSATRQTGYLVVGSALQSAFEVKNSLINRMILLLGENWQGELPPSGLWVSGHLAQMNIDDWLPWLRPMSSNKPPQDVASVMPNLQSFSVSFDDMFYGGYQLKNVRLGYERLTKASRFQITSNDLNGELIWPSDVLQPVKLNIQSLYLPFSKATFGHTVKKFKTNTNWSIPTVEINIKELHAKAWPHLKTSQLSATLKPYAQGLNLNRIVLKNPEFLMEGMMDWQWQGQERTSYKGQINVVDAAQLFESFNKAPSINSQQAQAKIALSWQGNPSELALTKLNGQLAIELHKGRVLQLNRALNLSRILGVLDSDNIKRRLKLDFSDITQKGLAYDDILFDANLVNGEMHNELIFKSPSLQAKTQGTVDLPSKTLNQHLEVSIPMASVVPYAAALVAGPVVGGALVAAEALLDNSLTEMATLHYDLTGLMTEPKMQRVKNPTLLWRKWRKPTPFKTFNKKKNNKDINQ